MKRRENEEKVKNWKKKYTCTAPPVNIASFEYKIVKNTRKQTEQWDSRANFVLSTVGTWCNNHIVYTLKISTADLLTQKDVVVEGWPTVSDLSTRCGGRLLKQENLWVATKMAPLIQRIGRQALATFVAGDTAAFPSNFERLKTLVSHVIMIFKNILWSACVPFSWRYARTFCHACFVYCNKLSHTGELDLTFSERISGENIAGNSWFFKEWTVTRVFLAVLFFAEQMITRHKTERFAF